MPGGKENASSGAATSSKPAVSSGDSSRQLVAAAAAAQAMQQHAAPSLASDTAAPAASAASAAAVAGSRQQVAGDRHEAAASAAQPPEQQQQQGYGEESLRSGSPDPQPPASVPKLLPRRFASRSFYGSRLRLGCASARAQEVEERIREHLFATQINAVKRQKALDGEDAPPPAVWRTFPVQQPAFDLADSQPGLEVFSGGWVGGRWVGRRTWGRCLWVCPQSDASAGRKLPRSADEQQASKQQWQQYSKLPSEHPTCPSCSLHSPASTSRHPPSCSGVWAGGQAPLPGHHPPRALEAVRSGEAAVPPLLRDHPAGTALPPLLWCACLGARVGFVQLMAVCACMPNHPPQISGPTRLSSSMSSPALVSLSTHHPTLQLALQT